MRPYTILCNGRAIKEGENEYYANVESLVPEGYRYEWAKNTPAMLFVHVQPSDEIVPIEIDIIKEIMGMKAWAKDNTEAYRMEM